MKPAAFDYERPESLAQATGLLGEDPYGNRVLSGGQSLGPMLNLRLVQPKCLVDVRKIPEMTVAEEDNGALLLGGCTTHSAIEDGKVPDIANGMMASVAAGIACRAVRNRGTVGGSLTHADPAADWPVCLLALDAEVTLHGPSGHRSLRLQEFLRGPFETAIEPGEILSGVRIPKISASARWGYYKFCRKVGEFAETMAAVLIDRDRDIARVVIGATEGRLIVLDQGFDPAPDFDSGQAAAIVDEHLPGVDSYKRRLHTAALRRAVAEATT